ncbi:MAG: hypothetical protein IKT82_07095 [Bacteroidaceae bacterium]|jgi:uncharacterized membrane protein HdeD (DUF308 family)|nr:hypothetical protein [Bacteroidaceae bacterium]
MKELTKFQAILYNLGGILMLIGALMPMEPSLIGYAAYVYTCGALAFGCMQLQQRYEGKNVALIRLRRQQIIASFLLIAAGIMFIMKVNAIAPFRGDEWQVALCIAAFLELYTAFRIPAEIKKENESGELD